jgi:hypothetical protein
VDESAGRQITFETLLQSAIDPLPASRWQRANISNLHFHDRSQDISVSIAMGYGPGFDTGRGKRFFSSPQRPD